MEDEGKIPPDEMKRLEAEYWEEYFKEMYIMQAENADYQIKRRSYARIFEELI